CRGSKADVHAGCQRERHQRDARRSAGGSGRGGPGSGFPGFEQTEDLRRHAVEHAGNGDELRHHVHVANIGAGDGEFAPVGDCYDAPSPAQRVEPDKVTIDPVTFNVTITFTAAQTGRCVIGGQTATGAGGGGASMSSQLGDLSLVLTTTTVLTAGLGCQPATP